MDGPRPEPDAPPRIDKTISFVTANLLVMVLSLPVLALVVGPFWLIWAGRSPPEELLIGESPLWIGVTCGALLAAIVAHEALHAVGFLIGGARWEDVRFGVKMMNPYAHCQAPLRASAYRLSIALPGLVLGVLPGLVGIVTGTGLVNLFGGLMLMAALGDVLILWIIRDVPAEALVYDHPSEVGCEVVMG